MRGLKSNLLYWFGAFEKISVSMFAGILVYALTMTMLGETFTKEEFASNLLAYCWIFLCVIVFILGYSVSFSNFPMTVSLGSSRKASFISMQVMQHVSVVQYLLLGVLAYYFLDYDSFETLMAYGTAIIGVVLFMLALTNVSCICTMKFGKIAGGIAYFSCFILIVVAVVIVFISGKQESGTILISIGEFVQKPYLLIGGVVADLVSIGIYYFVMKKADFQF